MKIKVIQRNIRTVMRSMSVYKVALFLLMLCMTVALSMTVVQLFDVSLPRPGESVWKIPSFLSSIFRNSSITPSSSSAYNYEYQNSVLGTSKILFTEKATGMPAVSIGDDQASITLRYVPRSRPEKLTYETRTSGNTITYFDVEPYTNLIYTVSDTGTTVKEDIELTQRPEFKEGEYLSYSFDIVLQGFDYTASPDGTVPPVFTDAKGTRYTIPPLVMSDKNGVTSTDLTLIITQEDLRNPNILRGILTPSSTWITAKDRQFPVLIDPTLVRGDPPAAYWKLDEGANNTCTGGTKDVCDAANQGHDGDVNGTPVRVGEEMCVSGKCLKFDGDDYIRADAGTAYFPMTTFSMCSWVKTPGMASTETNDQGILSMTYGLSLSLRSDGYIFSRAYTGSVLADRYTPANLNDNKWHHICFTHDGTNRYIYLDGGLVDTYASTWTGDPGYTNAIEIGCESNNCTNRQFNGFIDEVKVYPYLRTSDQIKSDYVSRGSTNSVNAQFGKSEKNSGLGLSNGLVGYWKLDESSGAATDSSGNAHTLTDASATTFAPGKYGNGADMESGSTDYQYIADNAALSITGSTSISAWIKPESVTAATLFDIAGKWDGASESYLLAQYGDEIRFYIDASANYATTDAANLVVGTWYYIAASYNAQTASATIMVNGVVQASTISGTIPSSIGDDAGRFHIGAEDSSSSAGNYYDGVIDEVRLYNRALSEGEVDALYSFSTPPVGSWKLDENTGTSILDSSGNSNVGTFGASAAAPAWGAGRLGNAVRFDGTDDYISIPESTSLDFGAITDSYTVGAWIKTSQTYTVDGVILSKYSSGAYPYKLYINTSGNACMSISDGTNTPSACSTNTVNDGQWHHVMGARDTQADVIFVAVDGIRRGAATDSTTSTLSNDITVDISKPLAPLVNTYYFNGSDAISDPTGVWANDANAFDGSTATYSRATNSTGSGNYLRGEGTDAPASGGSISQVRARFYAGATNAERINAYIYTDSVAELLGQNNLRSAASWSSYVTLATPTGGWTWPKLQHLEVQAYAYEQIVIDTFAQGDLYRSEIEVTTTYGTYFNGLVDDVKIYNYARTSGQITEDMNGGHPAPGSPIGSAVGHWKFDEGYGSTAYNSGNAGISQNGTISGATWTNAGKYGRALSFDGTADNVAISPIAFGPQFTWMHWIKTSSTASGMYTIGNASSGDGYRFGINAGRIRFLAGSGSYTEAYCGDRTVNDDAWHHIVGVFDSTNSTFTCYIDGTYEATVATVDFSAMQTAATPGIGAPPCCTDYSGLIDEVKAYNLSLDADQVKAEYNAGKAQVMGSLSTASNGITADNSASREYCVPGDTSTCNPPIAEWKLDENTGATANDTSGSGYTGTINNSPVFIQGRNGSALSFDGATQSVSLPASNSLLQNRSAISASVLVYFKTAGLSDVFSDSINNGGVPTTTSRFAIAKNASEGITCSGRSTDGESIQDTATTATLSLNRWYYISCIVDFANDTTLIYIDGVKQATTGSATFTNSATDNTTSAVGCIGARDTCTSGYFSGYIDTVRVFDYVRSDEQVAWEYNRGAPFAWYKFDECTGTSIFNSARNGNGAAMGNNGTMVIGASGTNTAIGTCSTSGAWFDGATGRINSSMDFDGTDDYVDNIIGPSQTGYNTITVAGWMNPAAKTAWFISPFNNGQDQWIAYETTNSRLAIYITELADVNNRTRYSTNNSVPASTWTHFALTINDKDIKIYINGRLDSEYTESIAIAPWGGEWTIGHRASANWYQGLLDDLRIYTYVMTPAQIRDTYNGAAVSFR